MTEKYNELKLYSPLTAELVTDEPDQDWGYLDVPDYAQNLDGQDLVEFRKVIEQGIADEVLPEEAERGLMAWYIQKDSINAKVHSLWQYADGWGEGFEQRERHCADGELYVHFYQPDKFFICTKEEMEQNRRRQQNKNVQKGGEAR